MRPLTLAEVAIATGGRVIADESAPTGDIGLSAIATDTRGLVAGAARILFVALRGERFDAHDFISDVVAATVSRPPTQRKFTVPMISSSVSGRPSISPCTMWLVRSSEGLFRGCAMNSRSQAMPIPHFIFSRSPMLWRSAYSHCRKSSNICAGNPIRSMKTRTG